MRIRMFMAIILGVCLLATGCTAVPAQVEETPQPQAEAPAEAAPEEPETETPAPEAAPTEETQPAAQESERAMPFGVLDGDTAYWCTGYGILSCKAGGEATLFSEVRGRNPVLLDGALYVIEDQTDTTEEVPFPVSMDAVTGSRILKLAAEAEPEEIYTAPYINQLYARDGRLYFTTTQGETLSEAGGLFSIDGAGQDEKLLSEECVQLHCVQDGYAYFEGVEEEREALCRVSVEGNASETLYTGEGYAYTPIAYEGKVYFIHLDVTNEDAEDPNVIFCLENGEATPLEGCTAQQLYRVENGKLYYLTLPQDENSMPALAMLDLSTLESNVLLENVMEVAALSPDHCLYSPEAPIFLAGALQLWDSATGSATALEVASVVESQG